MASTVSGSTAFTMQQEPETGTFQRRMQDVTNYLYDAEEKKVLGKTLEQWCKLFLKGNSFHFRFHLSLFIL